MKKALALLVIVVSLISVSCGKKTCPAYGNSAEITK